MCHFPPPCSSAWALPERPCYVYMHAVHIHVSLCVHMCPFLPASTHSLWLSGSWDTAAPPLLLHIPLPWWDLRGQCRQLCGEGSQAQVWLFAWYPQLQPRAFFFLFLVGKGRGQLEVPSTVRTWDSPKTSMAGQGPHVQQHWNCQSSSQPAFYMGAEINVAGTVPAEPSHSLFTYFIPLSFCL